MLRAPVSYGSNARWLLPYETLPAGKVRESCGLLMIAEKKSGRLNAPVS